MRIHYVDEGPRDVAGRGGGLRRAVPAHPILKGGNHFLQEDCGPELEQLVVDFIAGRLGR